MIVSKEFWTWCNISKQKELPKSEDQVNEEDQKEKTLIEKEFKSINQGYHHKFQTTGLLLKEEYSFLSIISNVTIISNGFFFFKMSLL